MNRIYVVIILFLAFPRMTLGGFDDCDPSTTSTDLCNPIGALGEDLWEVIPNLLAALGVMVGTIAILMVVLSGLRLLLSNGDADQIKKGKEGLKYSIGGFVISILAFVIVTAVESFIGAKEVAQDGELQNPLGDLDQGFDGFILGTLLPNFFGLLGVLAILMIVFNGFRYVLSAGNEEQAKKAKEGLQWAVIGLVVILLAYVLIEATRRLLGGT